MLAYMNRAAWEETLRSGKVTFFSRSRQSLWTKGETSGNFLQLKEAYFDCDQDTLLVKAEPCGPVCHTGSTTCFGEFPIGAEPPLSFLAQLESLIWSRGADPVENSYTCRLLTEGIAKIAQKVGEEGVEVVVAALAQENDDLICESADLIFHLMVLLSCRGLSLAAVVDQLKVRHQRVTRLNQAVF
jgi:phosphoribosyl-ATP pyrophosphohydrolase/phosphoribosyl-AMP cyclohydrolase